MVESLELRFYKPDGGKGKDYIQVDNPAIQAASREFPKFVREDALGRESGHVDFKREDLTE
jgi:hypothetical protein